MENLIISVALMEIKTISMRSNYLKTIKIEGAEIQDYEVFGLCPSSDILETRKHNVLETGPVAVLR
jgi:hypothetical protein